MDTVKVRELPVKSSALALTDLLVMEDNDGTKTVEVGQFRSLLQQSIYFNTVEDMKNATLHEGDVVQTLGFREINDGGGAIYKIVYAPTDLDDGMLIHYLHTSDTLRAHLIVNGDLNVLQCGVFGDGVSDDYTIINKAASKGYSLYFPKRTYRVTGPLEFPTGSVVDFNGSTIKCEVSSCICLGLKEEMNDITIKNTRFIGKYGIEIYPYSENIVIENCIFDALSEDTKMEKAISINGCNNIVVRNCTVGTKTGEVATGIQIASGIKSNESVGNSNILITGNKFYISSYGINMTSTISDKNTIISNNTVYGSKKIGSINGVDYNSEDGIIGVQMSCNSTSILINSCEFYGMTIGARVSGVVDVVLGLSDIICENTACFYSILSDSANVTISGLQQYTPHRWDNPSGPDVISGAIFERMSGKLVLNTTISSNSSIAEAVTSLTGYLIDSIDPMCRKPIVIESLDDLNKETTLENTNIPGYMNVSLNIEVSGNITDLKFPSLNGQLIALYSPNGAVLKHNTNILCGKDITLDQYVPVIIQNKNGLWTRVA